MGAKNSQKPLWFSSIHPPENNFEFWLLKSIPFLTNILKLSFSNPQQQCATEKSTKLGRRKRSRIAVYPECVGVIVIVVQCWLMSPVSVLHGGGEL